METEKEEKIDEVPEPPKVKVEKTTKKQAEEKGDDKYINIVTVAAGAFGLATFDVREMVLSGTVTIDGKEWRPKDGSFDIRLSDIDGKEVEIASNPKSIKFTLDYAALSEYRTTSPE